MSELEIVGLVSFLLGSLVPGALLLFDRDKKKKNSVKEPEPEAVEMTATEPAEQSDAVWKAMHCAKENERLRIANSMLVYVRDKVSFQDIANCTYLNVSKVIDLAEKRDMAV